MSEPSTYGAGAATGFAGFADGPARPPIARPLRFGLLALILFGALFAGWLGQAPLDSAAVAMGQISLDTNRKAVQHLEGGIVARILVRERHAVAAGQPLVMLDTTQAQAKIANLEAQISADERQLKLVVQEEVVVEGLYAKGLVQLPRLLQISRRRAELDGTIAQNKSMLVAAREILARTTIRAPIAGTVVNLQIHTNAGVIQPGATLMEIVPAEDPLVVEVRLEPNDIDVVRKGMAAQVRITPYNSRNVAPVKGEVVWVSADRLTESRTGQSYYLARIKIDMTKAGSAPDMLLYPGMPVEAVIVTGKRTAFEYFTGPLINSFNRAFREE